MNIIKVPIDKIELWDKNPRKVTDASFQRLKKQIQKLGFYKPLVCFEENGKYISIGGNQRLKALRELGFTEVEISVVYPKTDAEKVEYALSDNDEIGYYEGDRLLSLLSEYEDEIVFEDYNIDVGISLSAKEVQSVLEIAPEIDMPVRDIIHERESKPPLEPVRYTQIPVEPKENIWGIPTVKNTWKDGRVNKLMAFNVAKTYDGETSDIALHFFLNDELFGSVWNTPDKYVDMFRKFAVCFTPDFSLYSNYPLAVQLWNTYRNRWCGVYWQEHGVNVATTISWSDQRSYSFCFLGVERGSVVAVSNLGIGKDDQKKKLFLSGFMEMLKRVSPSVIYFYGYKWPELEKFGNIKWFKPTGFGRYGEFSRRY